MKLNEPQKESFLKLKEACKGAHYIDVVVRKDGRDLHFQIDYLRELLKEAVLTP